MFPRLELPEIRISTDFKVLLLRCYSREDKLLQHGRSSELGIEEHTAIARVSVTVRHEVVLRDQLEKVSQRGPAPLEKLGLRLPCASHHRQPPAMPGSGFPHRWRSSGAIPASPLPSEEMSGVVVGAGRRTRNICAPHWFSLFRNAHFGVCSFG